MRRYFQFPPARSNGISATGRSAALVLVLVFAIGCTPKTYVAKGVKKHERENVAHITADAETTHTIMQGWNYVVMMTRIDGKKVGAATRGVREAILAPGRHQIELEYRNAYNVARGCLWVDAEAGAAYRISGEMLAQKEGIAVRMFIVNVTEDKIVGGSCSSTPAPK